MAEHGAVSLTPGALRLRWDVFLSFRGEDTRGNITKELYISLEQQGVRVFRDDVGLKRGDEVQTGLIGAIEDSAAAIVILSPKYADSRWCLYELAKICEQGRLILPVFYRVDPADVQRQTGPFKNDMEYHEKYNKESVARWRKAMEIVGKADGWPLTSDYTESQQAEVIKSLVKKVLTELSKVPVGVTHYKTGIKSRVDELMEKMDVKSNGVRILVLYGKDGVGKTTLAEALYKELSGHFKCRSLVPNVREILAKRNGLFALWNKLITDLSPNVSHVKEHRVGINAVRWVLHENPVLVVLDAIDSENQVEMILGNREWIQEGSRIIITMRDRGVFPEHLVDEFYEVKELDDTEALKLLSYHALRREEPTDSSFKELSEKIVSLTGGLPLSLELIGSFLYDKKNVQAWKEAVSKIDPFNLEDVVRLCIRGLDTRDSFAFLNISCLFLKMGMKRDDAIDILDGCDFSGVNVIRDLISKSLVRVTEDGTLWMHDNVRDMGRKMAREGSHADCYCSRLWDREEIMSAFKNEKDSSSIQGIVLDFEKEEIFDRPGDTTCQLEEFYFPSALRFCKEICKGIFPRLFEKKRDSTIDTKALDKMVYLTLLQINNVKLTGKFRSFPQLKWLQWKGCPLKSLPSDYQPSELTVLDLSESNIERLWGRYGDKVAENLRILNLRGCKNLASIPDLSRHKNLKKLVLEGCTRLTKLHKSVGDMNNLLHLNLRGCSNLVELPSELLGLKNLKDLILTGCSKLREIPQSVRGMVSIVKLLADETAVSYLPDTIYKLTKLEQLSLNDCKTFGQLTPRVGNLYSLKELVLNGSAIKELPDSIGSLENLERLSLMCCESLTKLPDSIGEMRSLTELLLGQSAVRELPSTIGGLLNLKKMALGGCRDLKSLPDSVGGLVSVVELQLDETSITDLPLDIGKMRLLRKLEMGKCRSLGSLPKSVGSILTLTKLIIDEAEIDELPESVGALENLEILSLNKCRKLRKLPESIGNLKSLSHLSMEDTLVSGLPHSFGMLSSLRTLKMGKYLQVDRPNGGAFLEADNIDAQETTRVFNLSSLNELDIYGWNISGKIPDEFVKLCSLQTLNLGRNNFGSLPSGLKNLSILRKLLLPYCKGLKSLPVLPSSLLELNISNCTALESISDLSELERLQELNLINCGKVMDIPGLESLKSLRRLYVGGCNECLATVKKRLPKLCSRNLCNLTMPGSKVPDWFSEEVVRFSGHKIEELKGLLMFIVVSLNHEILDSSENLPETVDVEVEILSWNKQIYSAAVSLTVANTREDQLHISLFPGYHPLVSKLKDGCRIQVSKKSSTSLQGLQLKKCGFDLAFSSYFSDGGEGTSSSDSQLSVSRKLFELLQKV